MADSRLELVVEVDTNRANASIKSVNASLSSMESSAVKTARGAAQGIDGMTATMVKGATAGNRLANAIQSALARAKEFTAGSVKARSASQAEAERIQYLEKRIQRKDEVLAELMGEHIALKKELGEL